MITYVFFIFLLISLSLQAMHKREESGNSSGSGSSTLSRFRKEVASDNPEIALQNTLYGYKEDLKFQKIDDQFEYLIDKDETRKSIRRRFKKLIQEHEKKVYASRCIIRIGGGLAFAGIGMQGAQPEPGAGAGLFGAGILQISGGLLWRWFLKRNKPTVEQAQTLVLQEAGVIRPNS